MINTINSEHLLLATLGILIHALMKILARKDKSPFSFKIYFSNAKNWVRLILSFLSVFAILLMADDVSRLLNFKLTDGTPMKQILAFFAGYFNHSLIRRLTQVVKKKNDCEIDE